MPERSQKFRAEYANAEANFHFLTKYFVATGWIPEPNKPGDLTLPSQNYYEGITLQMLRFQQPTGVDFGGDTYVSLRLIEVGHDECICNLETSIHIWDNDPVLTVTYTLDAYEDLNWEKERIQCLSKP